MRNVILSCVAIFPLLAASAAPQQGLPASPVWQAANGEPTLGAKVMAARIARAAEDGLNPAHYPLPATGANDYDAAMTSAATAFIADLTGGRVRNLPGRPDLVRAGRAPNPLTVVRQVAASEDPKEILQGIEPSGADYRAVRMALAQAVASGVSAGPVIAFGNTIEPGANDARVPAIRARLGAPGVGTRYDAALQEAVRTFQRREGLVADGRIGRLTLTTLNEGNAMRARRLRVALDMLRDRPVPGPGPRIEVNIPEFWLRVMNGHSVVLEMPVIVGRRDRQTPPLRTALTGTVFNPPWGVPERNAREDLLPRLRRNPETVIASGYRVFQMVGGERQEVDPRTINWSTVDPRTMPYYFRQDAGEMNALGRIKFNIPNNDDIFMHDTPSRSLFGREERMFSSGCIRLGKPLELLEFVLGWQRSRIDAALAGRQTFAVPVQRPVPVLIEYRTAVIGSNDSVTLRADVYGLDELYARALGAAPTRVAVR